jgi:hypothetical protein
MTSHPLDDLRIASPCQASWEDMAGDARIRFCGGCRQNVYNLSEMSRTEAEAFVDASEGRHCLRFYKRADGTLITKDCSCGRADGHRQMARLGTRFALLFGLMAGAALSPRIVGSHPSAPASAGDTVIIDAETRESSPPPTSTDPKKPVASPVVAQRKPEPRPTVIMGAPPPVPKK